MPATADELYAFHLDARNLVAISPPFPQVRLLSVPKATEAGDVQVIWLGWGRIGATWEAAVIRLVPGGLIEDIQDRGPFRRWRHQHRFSEDGEGSVLTDVVSFRLLPTIAGEILEYFVVRPPLMAMLALRHRKTRALLGHSKSRFGRNDSHLQKHYGRAEC